MIRDVLTTKLGAQSQRLLAVVGMTAALTMGATIASAQPAAGPAGAPAAAAQAAAPVTAPATDQTAQATPPAGQPPAGTPPAGDPAAPAGEAPPPPPNLDPNAPTPPADPNAIPAEVPPAAAAPAAEGEKPAGHSQDLSPYGMFMQATIVVKVVMVALILASIVTWALLISKWLSMGGLNSSTNRVLRDFRDSKSLQDAAGKLSRSAAQTPAGRMLLAAADELRASGAPSNGEKRDHLTSRISARMSIAQAESNQEIGGGMQIFATTGSISPFVGLFGTVYGIMNSFIGIAQSQTTNLAVVAPGIAEALFATAIGLFAAIPAVIFYNYFARSIAAYNTRLDNFSGEVLVRLSRQLDSGA